MGRYEESEKLNLEVLELSKNMTGINQRAFAQALTNLAGLYAKTNRLEQAITINLQSLDIKIKLLGKNHPQVAITLNNLGGDYETLGKYDLADSLYKEAIKVWEAASNLNHTTYATLLANLAELYKKMNKYDESEQLFLKAEKIKKELLGEDHPDYAHLLSNFAGLYEIQGKFSDEKELRTKSINIYLNLIDKTFPFLSENEKGSFYTTIKFEFEKFNSFAIEYSKLNPSILGDIYNNQLILKGILFHATKKVRERIMNSKNDSLIFKFRQWNETKEYLSRLYRLSKDEIKKQTINLDSIEDIENFQEKVLTQESELFSKVYEKRKINWQDIQKALAKNEAAIEIIRIKKYGKVNNKYNPVVYEPGFTDSVLYAALIIMPEKAQPSLILLENGNELEENYLNQYRRAIFFHYQDRDSYNAFWSKIAKELKDIKKIYVSTDGIYNQINLNTIYNPITEKYLLDEYDICLLTNSKDLIENKFEHEEFANNIADFFGNPKFNDSSRTNTERSIFEKSNIITPLPGTQKEIDSISILFKINNWTINKYLWANATKEMLKSVNNPRVLHIATHGLFLQDIETKNEKTLGIESQYFAENPLLRSMLLLTSAENSISRDTTPNDKSQAQDGLFTAYEAMNLNLDNTELVVLSACETGLGVVKNGEGVYGLQRAFQTAGAKTMLMSLWAVNDEVTQELMTSFYRNWLSGKTKSEAFRAAQEQLKEKYKYPYFWGAFVMLGE
jgi:CHAT domain-containing protein